MKSKHAYSCANRSQEAATLNNKLGVLLRDILQMQLSTGKLPQANSYLKYIAQRCIHEDAKDVPAGSQLSAELKAEAVIKKSPEKTKAESKENK